jgi:hypothetical protein
MRLVSRWGGHDRASPGELARAGTQVALVPAEPGVHERARDCAELRAAVSQPCAERVRQREDPLPGAAPAAGAPRRRYGSPRRRPCRRFRSVNRYGRRRRRSRQSRRCCGLRRRSHRLRPHRYRRGAREQERERAQRWPRCTWHHRAESSRSAGRRQIVPTAFGAPNTWWTTQRTTSRAGIFAAGRNMHDATLLRLSRALISDADERRPLGVTTHQLEIFSQRSRARSPWDVT